jgi:hypothetical protein
MVVQQFKTLRELNRFLKETPIDVPQSRLNEIKTRAKKKKPSGFMVWVNPEGHVVELAIET